jgi:uncharacterized membrane protein YeaQ/YmgE (transglycosylase-associated protein family)
MPELQVLLVWLLIGAIAGWLAGQIISGYGFGLVGNIVVGVLGAILGGYLLGGHLSITDSWIVNAIVTATVGALILLFLIGLVRRA